MRPLPGPGSFFDFAANLTRAHATALMEQESRTMTDHADEIGRRMRELRTAIRAATEAGEFARADELRAELLKLHRSTNETKETT